jgi:hypothetical protein
MSKNWNIPRRSFLRGIGAMVALPLMESMYPSIRAYAGTAGNTAGGLPKRMAFVYAPNGKNMADWTPTLTGPDYDFPMILEPLRAFKKDMTIITGLKHEKANANGDGGGDHARSAATYLTGCRHFGGSNSGPENRPSNPASVARTELRQWPARRHLRVRLQLRVSV